MLNIGTEMFVEYRNC